MYYTIYKITNQVNGKFYIGSHKTSKLDDEYMGSGKYLIHAQEKYGIENFKKEILFVFDTPEEMYAKEAEIVNEDFLIEENTYNLKVGGFGGWDYLNFTGLNNSSKSNEQIKRGGLIHANRLKTDDQYFQKHSKTASDNLKKAHKENKIRYDTFTGKTHSEETKRKMSETHKKNNLNNGKNNSQFGTTWVWCSDLGNKKIKKEELEKYLDSGWIKTYKPGYKVPT